ncbi:hypothetical protein MPH_00572 [Macrophomina phaseolina MS6]|uniref:Uncharacterized protein n=1 Tax=Macrophomina phaseolina (strain MS6) TaxID=1126212 RepID=K2SB08_MACPH|nr:hypothetical protein MPH_00572 [Macrophomina phaseolina MS6]
MTNLVALLVFLPTTLALAAPPPQLPPAPQTINFIGDVSPDDNFDRAQLATEIGTNAQGQREFLQDGMLPIDCGSGDQPESCAFVP